MTKKSFKIKLLTPHGLEQWTIIVGPKKKDFGYILWEKKEMHLDSTQTIAEMVDTIIHESDHVATYEKGEPDRVTNLPANATAIMLKLGLINTGEED